MDSPILPPLNPTYEQLQEQIALLQQQMASLLQQQNSSAPASTSSLSGTPTPKPPTPLPFTTNPAHVATSNSSGIKVAAPDVFDGTISKADTFISQLQLYFHGKRVYDNSDRIVTALSYMKGGTAGPWAKLKVKWLETLDPGATLDWDAFVQDFRRTFGDPNPGGTARHKISQLKQGNHTADEYVASFRELKDETGYNDVALVEKFKKGLDQNLVDRIYHLPEMPQNLEEWISWAIKLDRQNREREVEKKVSNFFSRPPSKPQSKPFPLGQSSSSSSSSTNQPSTSVQARQPDVVPMEVDSGWRSVRPLICFKCRKPGHKAINCRSSVNINSMDHDSLKAYFKEEINKEEAQNQEKEKDNKDF